MRAVRYHGRGDVRIEDVPEPVLGPGGVRVAPAWTGICGTDLHLFQDGPFPPGGWRRNPHHLFTLLPSDSSYAKDGQIAADDIIIMGLQASTQWDGLAHVGYEGFFYNGVPAGAVNNFQGASKNDIAKVATKLVSRGVLLDIAGLKGVDVLPDSYEITTADVLAAQERQGVRVESGDIACIRTGWTKYFREGDRQKYVGPTPGPGLDLWVGRVDEPEDLVMLMGTAKRAEQAHQGTDNGAIWTGQTAAREQDGLLVDPSVLRNLPTWTWLVKEARCAPTWAVVPPLPDAATIDNS